MGCLGESFAESGTDQTPEKGKVKVLIVETTPETIIWMLAVPETVICSQWQMCPMQDG
jgi:hypothetical protein